MHINSNDYTAQLKYMILIATDDFGGKAALKKQHAVRLPDEPE